MLGCCDLGEEDGNEEDHMYLERQQRQRNNPDDELYRWEEESEESVPEGDRWAQEMAV